MKFRLRRYFLLTSLPVMVIITMLSVYGYIEFAKSILVEQESHANQQQTRLIGQLLWPRFQSHIMWSKNQGEISLRAAQAVEEIDKIVVDLFRGSNVIKAKLYNLDGVTVYSSQHSQIGADKSDNPGFMSASNGRVRSNLTWRNEFHAFEKIIMERDVVSSYLPLYDTRTREVIAVVELYSDVTNLVARIHHTRNQVIFGALTCFGLLLGLLYVLAVRADLLIRRQHDVLTDANVEISRLAYTDAVTQLPNRHRFDQALEEQIQHCRRHDEGFSLLYLDLDGFKDINDDHGHGAGDAILAEVGQRLKKAVRETDMVYRVGGDEFALMMPGANTPESVTQVAENLLARVAQPIEFGEQSHSVSTSIGIACYPRVATNAATLIELADAAMYRAKARGKNCYETAEI
ncbi:MAG: GGDEF domain-containing protein [Gammaproteobacteria bacterium]|nr:GGDEF domain-containing protein [Gammaproteobacteria bacterium]MCK5262409.1 GGDEF domain-containing protein [Gammaproteobacteria bacterium]